LADGKKKTKELKEVVDAGQQKHDPNTLVAYVSGPVYRIDVSAKSFDEAYAMAMTTLKNQLEKYGEKVRIEKIELPGSLTITSENGGTAERRLESLS
jgi:translation initiation factor 2 alpha subunit (eIF-2alpha)